MENVIVKNAALYDLGANIVIRYILKRRGSKRIFSSADVALRELERVRREGSEDIAFPIDPRWKTFAGREEFGGFPLYRFSPEKKSGTAVVYLHGGAFVNQPDPRHFKMVDRLCAHSGAEVFFPIYPKAPRHGFRETYALAEALYRELLEKYEAVVFMGDSAGAMLSVTLCGEFKNKGLPLPKKLILYSLVAETALDNPEIAEVCPRDPMQGADGLREYVKAWAGDEPISSPLIDPMSVDLSILPETVLFSGSDEIFCPDVRVFAKKARDAGADVTCCVFKNMYHCFPLFDLRAAKEVRRITCELLK